MAKLKCRVCPCMPLQRACKFLAIMDVILNLVLLILSAIVMVVYIRSLGDDIDEGEERSGIIQSAVAIFLCLVRIRLDMTLYFGAENRNPRDIKIWLITALIIVIINIVSTSITSALADIGRDWPNLVGNSILILFSIYIMIVAYLFLRNIIRDRKAFVAYMVESGLDLGTVGPWPTASFVAMGPGGVAVRMGAEPELSSQNSYSIQQPDTVSSSNPPSVYPATTSTP